MWYHGALGEADLVAHDALGDGYSIVGHSLPSRADGLPSDLLCGRARVVRDRLAGRLDRLLRRRLCCGLRILRHLAMQDPPRGSA